METIIRFSTAAMLHKLPMKPVISQKPWEKGHSSFNRAAAKEKCVSRNNINDSNCLSVADPGFSRGRSLLFNIMFAKNCIKMKKVYWEGGQHASHPAWSANVISSDFFLRLKALHYIHRCFLPFWFHLFIANFRIRIWKKEKVCLILIFIARQPPPIRLSFSVLYTWLIHVNRHSSFFIIFI